MRRRGGLARDERGFTLVETVMATALAALLMSTLGMAIHQFSGVTRLHSSVLTVNQQVQTAATLLRRDVVSAAAGVVGEGDTLTLHVPTYPFGEPTEPLTHTVAYALVGGDLVRTDAQGATVVARHVRAVDWGAPGPVGATVVVTMVVASEGREHSATLQFHRRPE